MTSISCRHEMIARPYGKVMFYDMENVSPLISFPAFTILIGNICDKMSETASAASLAPDLLSFCHYGGSRLLYLLFLTEISPYTTYVVI